MRALLTAVGTRGDVQPALALAIELRRLGQDVRLCISPNFVDWATRLGFEAFPMGVEMRMPAGRTGGQPALTPEELRRLRESMPDLITDQFETVGRAADRCDVIVGANAHQYAAPSVAELHGIGCVTAVYAPVALPSRDLAPPPPPGQSAQGIDTTSLEEQWRQTAGAWNERALERINKNRDRLGLGPIADVLDYVLTDRTWLAADATLAPAPSTPGRTVVQTGTWVLTDDTPLPAELHAFLDRGEAPLLAGFGSMPAASDVTRSLVDATRAVGRRLLVSKGWAALDAIADTADCLVIDDVNYELLLPRVAAFIHHGGAGTTAAAARAGVPQIVTPMFGDQFYWASRVVALQVGTTLPHAGLTEQALAASLRHVLDPVFGDRARRLAGTVRHDGAEVAARRLVAEYA